jgi:hypothetical protein
MRATMLAKLATLSAIVFASQMLSACSRVVSVDPLLAGVSRSAEHWEGAYVGTIDDEKRGPFPMLLRLVPRADGTYEFTIHAHGFTKDIFQAPGALDLVGRGEVQIADLGQSLAVAQTRCEMAMTVDYTMPVESKTMADMMDAARRFGASSNNAPHSKYLGPFVYAFLRGGPARPQAILGISNLDDVKEAAQGTGVDIVDKWDGGAGDGILFGSGLVFESDDIHIASHGGPGSAQPFFAHLAGRLFAAADIKNSIIWTRVAPEKLAALHFADRYPPPGQVGAWCNLFAAVPKSKD